MYYVYILKWEKYYCGYTNDIKNRIIQHKNWETYTTKRIWDFELLGFFVCKTKTEATQLERKIKKSGHIERFLGYKEFMKI
jgi:putative endonuclease